MILKNVKQNKELLKDYLKNYLIFKDKKAKIMYWAYDAIGDYAVSNNWNDLIQARAITKEAIIMLNNIEIPKFTLNDEVYNAFLDDGIDIDVVRIEGEFLQSDLSYAIEEMTGFLMNLYNDIYYKSDFSYLEKHVRTNRKCLDLNLRSHSYLINYILLQIKDDQLWTKMSEFCPIIFSKRGEWLSDFIKLEQINTAVLDEMETLLKNFNEFLGLSKYSFFLVQEAIENNDLKYLIPELNDIQGMHGQFLRPTWIDSDLSYQYVYEQNEDLITIGQGQNVDIDSSVFYVKTFDVKKEEIYDYISKLKNFGIKFTIKCDDTNNKLLMTVFNGESVMRITWTDTETLILLPSPTGELVPALLYEAIFQSDSCK